MWAALLLGLASGLVTTWIADWLPALSRDRSSDGTMVASDTVVVPRPFWRVSLLMVGSVAFAVYLHLVHSWSAAFWTRFILSELLLLIAAIDLEHRLVPNVLVAAGVALSLLFSILPTQPGLLSALTGALVAGVLFLLIAALGRGALGPGDVKLAILIGTINGYPSVLQALVVGIILGGLAAAVLMAARLCGPKQYIPYAPYLVAGCLSTLLFGQQIAHWWGRLPVWGG